MKVLYLCGGPPYPAVREALRRVKASGTQWTGHTDESRPAEVGRICFIGCSEEGHEVYAAGLGGSVGITKRALAGLKDVFSAGVRVRMIEVSAGRGVSVGPVLVALGHMLWARLGATQAGKRLIRAGLDSATWSPRPFEECPHPVHAAAGNRVVVYHCYGSAHSSVVAAAIHLGRLPATRPASVREICSLHWFDRVDTEEIGTPIYLGSDSSGTDVYVLGLGSSHSTARRTVSDFKDLLLQASAREAVFVDCLPLAGVLTRVGGFISKRIGVGWLGKPLAAWGIRKKYWEFVRVVCNTRIKMSG